MTFIGKLLRGAKGIGLQLLNTAIPNLVSNKAMEAGGVGKTHIPSAITSWIYAAIALVSVAWTIYRLATGASPEEITVEQDLINSATN